MGKLKASIGSIFGTTGWAGGGTDVTPNPLNWTNITGEGFGQTNTQTIAGINVPITLRIESDYNSVGQSNIYVNDVEYQMADDFGNDGFHNQIVNNGDTIYFYRLTPGGSVSETVTVKNSSDSNVVLDTFTISLTGGG